MVFKFLSFKGNSSQQAVNAKSKILKAFVPFAAKTGDFEDFSNEKSLFFRLSSALSEANIIVIGADTESFPKFKRVFSKALSFKNSPSYEIRERIVSLNGNMPEDELNTLINTHAVTTENADVLFSEDGLFCGVGLVSNGQSIILLPLDDDRIDYILKSSAIPFLKTKTSISHEADKPFNVNEVSNAVDTLLGAQMSVCFAPTQTALLLKEISKDLVGFSNTFSFMETESPRGDATPKQYAANLAREAKLNSSATFGAAITKVFKTDDPSERMFVYICVADETNAKIRRVFAEPYENPIGLINAAMEAICSLIVDKVSETVLKSAASTEFETVSKASVVTKSSRKTLAIIITCLIVLSLLLCVVIGLFIANMNNDSKAGVNQLVLGESLVIDELTADGEDNLIGGVDLPAFILEQYTETISEEPLSNGTTTMLSTIASTIAATTTTLPVTQKVVTTTAAPVQNSSGGKFVFTVYGYGHGVGMSQRGAKAYADKGWSYDQILLHYYPGITIVKEKDANYPETLTYSGKSYSTSEAIARICIAEIGSGANKEALKAQAVAAYTYLRTVNSDFNTSDVSGIALSTSASGATVGSVISIISPVDGYYATYNGKTANTVFFAMSAGRTTSAKNAWGSNMPYLVSVDSSIDKSQSQYQTTLTYSAEELKSKIEKATGQTLTGDPSTWIEILEHDSAVSDKVGYVSKIRVGSETYKGTFFRGKILSYTALRSHCFSVEYIA